MGQGSRLLTVMILCSVLVLPASGQGKGGKSARQSKKALQEGRAVLKGASWDSERLKEALKHFERADNTSPKPCPRCLMYISLTAGRMHKGELALKAAEEGIALQETPGLPNHTPRVKAVLHNARALALAQIHGKDRLQDVIASLENAVALLPSDVPDRDAYRVRSNLSTALDVLGEEDRATEVLKDLLPPREAPSESPPMRPGPDAGNIRAPAKISTPFPEVSELARIWQLHGTVQLEAVIDVRGRAGDSRVIQSIPGLNSLAIHTVESWTFSPATQAGVPVAVFYNLKIRFPPL